MWTVKRLQFIFDDHARRANIFFLKVYSKTKKHIYHAGVFVNMLAFTACGAPDHDRPRGDELADGAIVSDDKPEGFQEALKSKKNVSSPQVLSREISYAKALARDEILCSVILSALNEDYKYDLQNAMVGDRYTKNRFSVEWMYAGNTVHGKNQFVFADIDGDKVDEILVRQSHTGRRLVQGLAVLHIRHRDVFEKSVKNLQAVQIVSDEVYNILTANTEYLKLDYFSKENYFRVLDHRAFDVGFHYVDVLFVDGKHYLLLGPNVDAMGSTTEAWGLLVVEALGANRFNQVCSFEAGYP